MIDGPAAINPAASIGAAGKELLKSLPESHVLGVLVQEHDLIIGFLREVDALRNRFMQTTTPDESRAIIDGMREYAWLLLGVESHQLREEEVVCLELEKLHISRPPAILRQEHNLLRPLQRWLVDLVTSGSEKMDPAILRAEIDGTVDRFISNFMLHMQKENEWLFPLTLEAIDDPAVWEKMRVQCDDIGYCFFTPVINTSRP